MLEFIIRTNPMCIIVFDLYIIKRQDLICCKNNLISKLLT